MKGSHIAIAVGVAAAIFAVLKIRKKAPSQTADTSVHLADQKPAQAGSDVDKLFKIQDAIEALGPDKAAKAQAQINQLLKGRNPFTVPPSEMLPIVTQALRSIDPNNPALRAA